MEVEFSTPPPFSMKAIPLSAALLLLLCQCESAAKKSPTSTNASTPASSAALPPVSTPEPKSAAPTVHSNGVVTTSSGLSYRVLTSGPVDGRSPGRLDSVMVHYHGTLTDGTVFDSSYQRGMPATFGVGQVIPGWTEALQLMKPGDKWMLHIPSRLAYGSQAVGGKIPPNSDLIFQVELLQVMRGF